MNRRVGDVALATSLSLVGLAVAALIVLRATAPNIARPVTR